MNGTEWKDEQERLEFEAALTRSLRRVDAPEDFAARIVALAQAEERTARVTRTERVPWWRVSLGWKPVWGAAAAIVVAGVLSGHAVHERHAEEQARTRASREFEVSEQITERALDHAQGQAREQLRRAGVSLDGEQ